MLETDLEIFRDVVLVGDAPHLADLGDDRGGIVAIVAVLQRRDAQRLVEQCLLACLDRVLIER